MNTFFEKLRLQDEADSLRAQLATATERATKAEAGLSLAVRALKSLCDEIGLTLDERHDAGLIPRRILQAAYEAENRITEPAIVAEAERLKALEKDRERLDWLQEQTTDTIYLDDGRIVDVKGDSVRAAIDTVIAQLGNGELNGLADGEELATEGLRAGEAKP